MRTICCRLRSSISRVFDPGCPLATTTSQPSATRFAATLAAMPLRLSSRVGVNTGTGASGLMRSTMPYW